MLTRHDPFREALSLRRVMDQLLEQSFVDPGAMRGATSRMMPAMDIRETSNGYEVDVALPGVQPEDIELVIDQNTLTIRGDFTYQNSREDQPQEQTQEQRQEQKGRKGRQQRGGNWLAREIVYGSFERAITLPRAIDVNNIQTNFQNGMLTIQLPVSEASRPRQISVTGDQSQPRQVTAKSGQQQEQQQGQRKG